VRCGLRAMTWISRCRLNRLRCLQLAGEPATQGQRGKTGWPLPWCGVMAGVTDREQARLGAVQETLFIPLAARARAAQRRRPVLRDPKAVQIAESVEIDAKYGRGARAGQ
jgi:hypothetical protein